MLHRFAGTSATLLAALALTPCASAADAQTEALLAKMRSAYRAVKSARYSLNSTVNGQAFSETFDFLAPTFIRTDIKATNGQGVGIQVTLATDGTTVTGTMAGKPAPVRPFTLDTFERILPANLESLCFFDWSRQLSTAPGKNMAHSVLSIESDQSWLGRKWIVLVERAMQEKVLCHYFVDPRTDLIWRTTVRQFGGAKDVIDARLTKLDLNVSIPKSRFKLEGAAGNNPPLIRT